MTGSCTARSTAFDDVPSLALITVSDADVLTPTTAREILAHNRAVAAAGRKAPLIQKGDPDADYI